MGFKIYCVTGEKQYNITPIVGNFSWGKDIRELATRLNFTTAHNDDRYFPINPIDIGSQIILRHTKDDIGPDETIFKGVIISEEKNGRDPISYVAADPAFWLNKSKEFFQFYKLNAKTCITQILKRFNVQIGEIASMRTSITDDYSGAISDTIKDIIQAETDATGIKYKFEFRDNKFYLIKLDDNVFKFNFSIADNIALQDITNYISNPSKKRTLENMVNTIKVVYTEKKHNITAYTTSNKDSVAKYGVFQDIISTSKKEISQAKQIANNRIKKESVIPVVSSIEVPGNYKLKDGYVIELNETTTGLIGKYRIKRAAHTVSGKIHNCRLDLEVI